MLGGHTLRVKACYPEQVIVEGVGVADGEKLQLCAIELRRPIRAVLRHACSVLIGSTSSGLTLCRNTISSFPSRPLLCASSIATLRGVILCTALGPASCASHSRKLPFQALTPISSVDATNINIT